MMKIRRRRDGSLAISLPYEEGLLLRALPNRLRAMLESPDFDERVTKRLFPPAYRDPEKEREYRELLGEDLRRRKLEAVELFESTLRRWRERGRAFGRRVEILVREEDFDLWLSFVNDMRLLLATELDIQDESWGTHFDPDDPQAEELLLLHYLSWLEEMLLRAQGFPGIEDPGPPEPEL